MTVQRWGPFEDFWQSYMWHEWETFYSDVYQAAEAFISASTEQSHRKMLEEIDALMALPAEADRRAKLPDPLEDIGDEAGDLDAFIADFRARVVRELAGDRSDPLVDRRPAKPGPLSPQGWDVTLPSAGSFPTERMAQAVTDAVLKHFERTLREEFAESQPGVTRRLPPMRMRFDKDVGTVAVRDGETTRTRLAVVLVHDRGGEALVFSAFPMEEVLEPPKLQALFVMLGAWLHADWVDEVPTYDPLEQVRRFAAAERPDTVRQAAVELHALRSAGTEDERRAAVRGLCCFFLPRPPGQLDAFLDAAAEVLTG